VYLRFFASLIALYPIVQTANAQQAFTVRDAILMAVHTHPGVGEAAANRRATESELRQTQSTLLPQVRLEAQTGPEMLNLRDAIPTPSGNNDYHNGSKASLVVRQLLFDGFASINDIWRQAARVDAAAARVHERTELLALDAVEAYIDVLRYTRLIALAQENVNAHTSILSNVRSRFSGGRAGEGDLEQTTERVQAARVTLTEFRRSLDEARAKFRRAIGVEPYNMRVPGRLPGMPANKDESLAVALRQNPTLKAAQSDADAARYAFRSTAGNFSPNVSLEGRVTRGKDTDNFTGRFDEVTGKVVMSWDIFNGGRDLWRRNEAAERFEEQSMRHARLQRDTLESIDKAWAARTITNDRILELTREIASGQKVVSAYSKEYDIGQRSLIDLLNAENQLFNAQVSLVSARYVAVFADYQLLAAMGELLDYVKAPHPVDAEPLETKPFGLLPTKLPPVLVNLPAKGPEPLNVNGVPTTDFASVPDGPKVVTFADRWRSAKTAKPNFNVATITPAQAEAQANGSAAMSYADNAATPSMLKMSLWSFINN
jgi:adhesin transport system outer membrane protein